MVISDIIFILIIALVPDVLFCIELWDKIRDLELKIKRLKAKIIDLEEEIKNESK